MRLDDHVLDRDSRLSYLAAADDVRASAFTDAWLNPEASAVIIARGGYGSQRVVDLVDWRRLAEAEPKVLVGFSDATALHQAVAARLGLVTVHSHVVTSLGTATPASAEALRRLLMEPDTVTDLLAGQAAEAVVGGMARGVLVGGNLALLASDLGTPFSRSAAGGIVLLEDIGEDTYRVDRQLTHLVRAGWFEGARGLVLGAFTDCNDPVELDVVLEARLAPLGLPIVRHVDVGHTSSSATVPLGVEAVLDADAGTLVLTRPALT
ncbi:MAG: LD-carboxypeptidase [Nocardioidaceae bacterium]